MVPLVQYLASGYPIGDVSSACGETFPWLHAPRRLGPRIGNGQDRERVELKIRRPQAHAATQRRRSFDVATGEDGSR
jgi:hypothetical protein